jgi:signal transduction histidine kinase
VATGRTDARVPEGTSGDALDDLSASFNAMLDRIGALVGGMRDALDNVAHDLRTPLARLRARAERALASDSAEAQREALADCLEESDRILAILNTLMDISEAETGTIRLALDRVALGALAAEVAELYEDVAADKQVTLAVHAAPDVTVTGDRERLRQALANLVDNAIKYGPPAATVTIVVRADEHGARVEVRDQGPGIPADELPSVWDRLFRGDRSRSERGLGLGLSLVCAFVRAHGGQVSVESAPGHGSTFSLHLPPVPPPPSPDITRV